MKVRVFVKVRVLRREGLWNTGKAITMVKETHGIEYSHNLEPLLCEILLWRGIRNPNPWLGGIFIMGMGCLPLWPIGVFKKVLGWVLLTLTVRIFT